jgi:ribonuclease BN (tRNA processing enzyme)
MKLTVLGASASYPGPGQACAGYLVVDGDTAMLLDCGNGVVSQLGLVYPPLEIDGIVVSHAHPDHIADLFAMQALLRYAPEGPAPPMPLWGPPGLLDRMSCLLSDHGASELADAFAEEALTARDSFRVGGVEVRAFPVEHGEGAFGLVVTGSGKLCYTGDAPFGPELVEAARGADVLLAEATLPRRYAGMAPHMTASEAATVAADACANTLVLTHVWPTSDRDAMLREAREVFSGDVLLAEELLEVPIG